jgi:glucarate dehydratase
MSTLNRRQWLAAAAGGMYGLARGRPASLQGQQPQGRGPLKITGLKITPIALPDPPILAAGGCHGPYFLRNVIELETDAGIVGIGETRGGESITLDLEKAREIVVGQNAFAYRRFSGPMKDLNAASYAGIELACLDACGKATGRRLCELLGGPVREDVEFAAYLFYRYAADHPRVLDDLRLVDDRGAGGRALDNWGEVRSPEAMAEMADRFRRKYGFRVFKLKAGVLPPAEEIETLHAINSRFGGKHLLRIDPNARWKLPTALDAARRIRDLPLEYYEDPVAGQEDMAKVRRETGLTMSTNMCVTRFAHIPPALRIEPIDVVLCDHHGWGGITACQALGQLCDTIGWKVSQHSNNHAGITMAAMIHVGALLPQLTLAGDTHYVWLPEGADIIAGPNLPISGGRMQIPAAPGVGVQLDRDKLARAHETYRKSGMRSRDDAFTMRRFVPGWSRTLF